MAGSKKKKSSTLILLLIAMVFMIVACLWLVRYKEQQNKKDSEESTKETESIVSIKADDINTIYFKNESGEMTLNRDGDNWKDSGDDAFPVNQTYAKNMMNAFTDVSSSRKITEGIDDLSAFGLDKPTIEVKVTDKNGKATSMKLGAAAPVGDGYYAVLNDGKEVYIVTSAFYNNFKYSLTEMTAVETIPSITSDHITHLTIDNKDKPDFEVVYDKDKAADLGGFTNWIMKQPYKVNVPANADSLKTLLQNYAAITFTSCVDYDAKDLSKYGLDKPASTIHLEYYEEYTKDSGNSKESTESADTKDSKESKEAEKKIINNTLDLLIGSKDADGNYYAKRKDSKAVNIISADAVKNMTEVDAYSNTDKYVNLVNIDSVDKIDINVDGRTYNITMDRTKNTADSKESKESKESKDSVTTKYFFNGKEAKEEDFKTLYQLIISPMTEREIPKEYFTGKTDQTPYMKVTYSLNTGKKLAVQYKPYDDSYYVANTDGVELFLTDMRKVKEIAASLADFAKKVK